jgi:hypothetical protein
MLRREANRRFIKFLLILFIAVFIIWCALNAIGVRFDFDALISMYIGAFFALLMISEGMGGSDKGYTVKDNKEDQWARENKKGGAKGGNV